MKWEEVFNSFPKRIIDSFVEEDRILANAFLESTSGVNIDLIEDALRIVLLPFLIRFVREFWTTAALEWASFGLR